VTDILHRLGRKALDAKAKHRWLTACAQFRGFMDTPGVLRVAILLFEYYDPQKGFAWPSRRTLAERLGSPPESVSRWMHTLKLYGAIQVVKTGDVPANVREATRKTSKRANYYRLNFEWAEAVLDDDADINIDDEDDEFQQPAAA
jgi:hypothetical protein